MKTKVSLIWAYYSYGADDVIFTDIPPKERTETTGYWALSPNDSSYNRIKSSLLKQESYTELVVYTQEPMRYL